MRDRDAGIGQPANACGDPWNDPKRDTGGSESQRLFPAAPEDAGIAALQPQHAIAGPSQPNQPRRDIRLARRRAAAALARIIERGGRASQTQDALIDQRVIDDAVRARQSMQRQGGKQPGVARTRPDKPYATRIEIGKT